MLTPETKGAAMNVSDADSIAAKCLWDAISDEHNSWEHLSVSEQVAMIEAFASHRHEAIEMATGVIENECDELTFEQRNTAARRLRALAGEGE